MLVKLVKTFLFYMVKAVYSVLKSLVFVCLLMWELILDKFCTSHSHVGYMYPSVPYRDPDKVWFFKGALVCTLFAVASIVLCLMFS